MKVNFRYVSYLVIGQETENLEKEFDFYLSIYILLFGGLNMGFYFYFIKLLCSTISAFNA